MALISILSIYEYDNSIFDGVIVPENVDKEVLINTILYQNAELQLLYSDPDTLKNMITLWSKSSAYTWEKMAKTLDLVYNPIWNKDGKITESEEITSDQTGTLKVSAFNQTDFANRQQTESEAGSGREYTRIEQGNIGVTSTQQLIKEERETALFNFYDVVSNDFKNRFCIMVY